MKNTHGGVLILVKLQASARNFTKINTPPWVFFTFLNCTNASKSHNAPHIFFYRSFSDKQQVKRK